jgi:hypothetical protein
MEDVMRDSPVHVRYCEIGRTAATASASAAFGKAAGLAASGRAISCGEATAGLGHSETGAGPAPGRA